MTLSETYRDMADRFEAESLDARGFTHVDHIGVACQMLQRYEFLEAAHRFSASLRAIAAKAGAAEKFNATITLAFLSLLSERMANTPHASFGEFLEKNPDLTSRSLMETWYSPERLGSKKARETFLMPDRFSS